MVNELSPSTEDFAKAFPKFTVTFGVLNEFFNELAYNPGSKKAGFLFFLDWGNHDLNSVVSTSDANGPLGRSLVYFNCEVLPMLKGVSEVNPTVNLLVGLLNPPTKEECQRSRPDRHGGHGRQHLGDRRQGLGAQRELQEPAADAPVPQSRLARKAGSRSSHARKAAAGTAEPHRAGRREHQRHGEHRPAAPGAAARPCRSALPRSATSS